MITKLTYNVANHLIGLVLDPASAQTDIADYISEWKEWATDDYEDADGNEWQWAGTLMVLPGTYPAICDVTYVPAECRKVEVEFALVK